ncbi:MAG TPA: rhomboid family intramembrane serine protease [Thermodesulfovibrionales bacterium]|nr:rhomboid family intramembrane serine protease [Thermodesulfovibrionales bacterium]
MFPYKDDNPSNTFPAVTIGIIVLNVVVFILQVFSARDGQQIVYSYGAIPHNIISMRSTQPIHPALTLFTSMFMHGGLFHIFGNMLYLWIFGNNIEDRLGHFRFILFYLFCGIAAAMLHALTAPESAVPMIGASGAISGVLGAYVLLFPYARIHTIIFLGFFVQTVRIPALIVIGFWAIIQIVSGLTAQGLERQEGVAWFAHVGGFIAGLLSIKLWQPRRSKTW